METLDQISTKYSVKFNVDKPSDSQGLNEAEVKERLEKYGPNRLTPPKKWHPLIVYLFYVTGVFNLMLLVAGVASLILFGINQEENFSLVCKVLLYIGS